MENRTVAAGPAVFYTVSQGVRGALRRTLPRRPEY